MSESEDEIKEPAPKKLRSAEPDLCIIVQYTDHEKDPKSESGQKEDAKQVQKEYRLYSQVLSKQSKFVDTSLSVGMKEKETKTIVFKDVTPEVFEKALLYLEDLEAVIHAKPADIIPLVGFYHMYEFEQGLKFADTIISTFFLKAVNADADKPPYEVDLMVELLSVAHQFDLERSLEEGIDCMQIIANPELGSLTRIAPTMLKEEHIAKLQPLLFRDIPRLRLPFTDDLSKAELESPLFPKYFIKCVSEFVPSKLSITFAELGSLEFRRREGVGTTRGVHWRSKLKKRLNMGGIFVTQITVERIRRSEGGHFASFLEDECKENEWGIVAYDATNFAIPMYWAPCSSHQEFPPLKHWEETRHGPFDADSVGKPTLSYII